LKEWTAYQACQWFLENYKKYWGDMLLPDHGSEVTYTNSIDSMPVSHGATELFLRTS
jgi:hypothetical protein